MSALHVELEPLPLPIAHTGCFQSTVSLKVTNKSTVQGRSTK